MQNDEDRYEPTGKVITEQEYFDVKTPIGVMNVTLGIFSTDLEKAGVPHELITKVTNASYKGMLSAVLGKTKVIEVAEVTVH